MAAEQRPARRKSRLTRGNAGVTPAAPPTDAGEDESAARVVELREARELDHDDPYPADDTGGRLTVDVNRKLRQDLKAWAATRDATIADVVRALAKLVLLGDVNDAAHQAITAAIGKETRARHYRADLTRRGLL